MIDGGTEVSTVHHRDVHGYYLALQNYFSSTQTKHDRSNSPRAQKARAKLLKLSASQFYELSTDVYDELQRRISDDESQPEYLLPRATFHMKRNQARQKLANLSHTRFNDLVDDILFEIKRRGYNTEVNPTARSSTSDNKKANNSHSKSSSNVTPGSDGYNSQIPPTATIQASKVIPQKASIDWSSDEEEQDTKKNDNTHVDTNSISKTPDTDKHDSVLKDPKSKHPSTLHQPGATPNLLQTESYYQYGGIIDSPGLNGTGNYQKGNEKLSTESPNNDRDSNTFDFEGMVKDDAVDPASVESSNNPQKKDQLDQLSMEIEALKKENASLRQSRSLRGINSNKTFEEDLNSLSVEVGSLSVENEELKAKISELEFKLKNSESQDQISPGPFFGNGKKELEKLVVDRESITRYAAEDGSIPFDSVQEFHLYVQKLFADLQTEIDDIGHTLFEDLARLSHTLAQLFILVDLPEYKEEIILLKASLSHTITSIRYFAVFGALLPKITVQAAISELAFAFCNLVRSCKIKGDGRGGAALGPYKLALNAEKASLTPQSPSDPMSNSKFSSSFHRPTVMTQLNDDESGKDEMSPVKPLKLTQKVGMSPNLGVPSAGRKPSNGLMIGPMIETKSPPVHAKNTPAGFHLNGTSPTISKPEGIDESLLARMKVSSQNKEAVSKNDPNSTLNDSTIDKSMATSRATTAEGTTTLSSPPSTSSSNEHIETKDGQDVKHNNDYPLGSGPSKNISNDANDSYHSNDSTKSEKQIGISERTLNDSGKKKEQQLPSTSTPKQEAFKFRDLNHFRTPQSSANVLESPKESKDTPEAIKDTRSKLEGNWRPVSHEQVGPRKASTKQPTAMEVEAKSKDNDYAGKAKGRGQQSQSQEEKSKKNTGKSFTEKLKNFATNAGIGLRVDKEQKDKQAASSGSSVPKSKINGIGGSKKSTSSVPNSNGSGAAIKVSHKNGESTEVSNDVTKTSSAASKKNSIAGGNVKGLNVERSIASPRKDGEGSKSGTDKENRVASLPKLNTKGESGDKSIPSSDTQRVDPKSPASIGPEKEIPTKLPNFYFNNIPDAPPTSSNLTNKLKETFADLPSEDENEGGSTNNSPYMSDSGSIFRSLKQSLKEENGTTRHGSPLAQQQNFHHESTDYREMPAGLGLSKETSLKFDDGAGLGLSKETSLKFDDGAGLGLSKETSLKFDDGAGLGLSKDTNSKFDNKAGLGLSKETSLKFDNKAGLGLSKDTNSKFDNKAGLGLSKETSLKFDDGAGLGLSKDTNSKFDNKAGLGLSKDASLKFDNKAGFGLSKDTSLKSENKAGFGLSKDTNSKFDDKAGLGLSKDTSLNFDNKAGLGLSKDTNSKSDDEAGLGLSKDTSLKFDNKAGLGLSKDTNSNFDNKAGLGISKDTNLNFDNKAGLGISEDTNLNFDNKAGLGISEDTNLNFDNKAGLGVSKDTNLNFDNKAGLGVSKDTDLKFNDKTGQFLSDSDNFSKPSFSRDSQDHHSHSIDGLNTFHSKNPEELDDSLNSPGEAVREQSKDSSLDIVGLNLAGNSGKEKEHENTSVNDVIGLDHSDDGSYKKNERHEHAEDKSLKNAFGLDHSAQTSNQSEDGKHVGVDSPGFSRATGKTRQSSGDLNSDPSFGETKNHNNTSTTKVDNAVMPKLQPVKLYPSNNQSRSPSGGSSGDKTEVSKRENSIKGPKVPKTPVMKKSSFKRQTTRTPSGKTPNGKTPNGKTPNGRTPSSSTRSPVMKSPGTRSIASSRTDDAESFDVDAFDIENPDNTLSELLLYLEHQSLQVISTIQSLLTSIKEPHATKGNLRKESNAINQVIRQMVDATSVSMNQSRNASLKEHGTWVVKSLEDCYLRVTTLCHLNRNGDFSNNTGDENHADKHFKQRLAGIAFDIAKCTKELVKTVEEASLKEEIEFLNARLN